MACGDEFDVEACGRPTQFRDEDFLFVDQLFESKFLQFVKLRTIFVGDGRNFLKSN